jgi:hypothetical protein
VTLRALLVAKFVRLSGAFTELAGVAASDLIDNTFHPIGRVEDGTHLALTVEKAQNRGSLKVLGEKALSPRR